MQCLEHTARHALAVLAKHAFRPRSSGSRPRRGSGNRSRCTGTRNGTNLETVPYQTAAACTNAQRQGTKLKEGPCLIHRRHTRRVPAPDVLVERLRRVERLPANRAIHRVKCGSKAACAPSRISRLYGAAGIRHEESASIEGGQGTRLQADAAAMQADATAPRVPSTQCMTLPACEARTEPLAVPQDTRLDGCWHCLPGCLPSMLSVRRAAVAGRAEASASAADARACCTSSLHSAPYSIAAACTNAQHQGSEPEQEHT